MTMTAASLFHDTVTFRNLPGEASIPLLVEPAGGTLDIAEWGGIYADPIDGLLRKHGALLFRGFDVDGIPGFERLVDNLSEGERLPYIDRSTPRESRADRVYTATTYPPDQVIKLHNEGTYWIKWPLKLFFYCSRPAASGGETPIADVSGVLQRIDPAVREEFERRRITYVRNYSDRLGMPWQQVFQTQHRDEVEKYCRSHDIELEWRDDNRLRTRQVRPAIRVNPRCGSSVWFNHAAFFNVHALEPGIRKVLMQSLEEEDLPYNTYFGDGGIIDEAVVRHVLDAYAAEEVVFRWQEGDILLLENMSVAHGRRAFTGEREVLVAMTEACGQEV